MQFQAIELVGDETVRAGHEAGADAKRFGPKPQIKTCRLDLILIQRPFRAQAPAFEKRRDCAVRQYSCVASHHAPSIFEATKPNRSH